MNPIAAAVFGGRSPNSRGNLTGNFRTPAGQTGVLAPLGNPYVNVRIGDNDSDYLLWPGEIGAAILEFTDPTRAPITYDARVLSVTPTP